ncbi:unnamed protein product [Mesocestoides corti]|uniref:Uncharacterized protein n=1 Tax=Mesocestoides corti TaxID=53468 RepID=A0A0R3U2L4_MESCO|nr:unnamed protein product [Mesocestoides corti]
MTSSSPNLPEVQVPIDVAKEPRSVSPMSCYDSSPERVTTQNQLLKPAFLLSGQSRVASELDILEPDDTHSSGPSSTSESTLTVPGKLPRDSTHHKPVSVKRMGWVKLIRLQLNALHEQKARNAAAAIQVDTKRLNKDSPAENKEDPWPVSVKETSQCADSPPDSLEHAAVACNFIKDSHESSMNEVELKSAGVGGPRKKK